ncbi:MarR family winged helix-turn-helix transcriptional regulator [Litoreibacter roseus]|uniref:MarR family transcriptional regulator n=1 Tax=Litoreibacter roseus TaxID=2601869 RepID=A0A6N6JJR0_9RHOB|nr:MarR family transcriptional regulator [Litoreibacter roseus]GFE65422.1 MarR family transcriptional regulator [Litoreibacter roseus]
MTDQAKRYALHSSIGYHATLAARVFERRLEDGLRRVGLTRLNWCILLAVGEEALTNPSDIAGFIGIDRTATSRALRQLERDGLITRAPSTNDRRRTDVALTGEGERCLSDAIPIGRENNTHFTTKLSSDEHLLLVRLLAKMRSGETENLTNF